MRRDAQTHTTPFGWIAAAFMALAACEPTGPASLVSTDALDHAIGDVIGDPTTCVIIAERAPRKVIYTYGDRFNCIRGLPTCDRPGVSSARSAVAFADSVDGRGASCPSNADGSRRVGWAEGRITSRRGDWIYSAVIEGENALPGREMSARLAQAGNALCSMPSSSTSGICCSRRWSS